MTFALRLPASIGTVARFLRDENGATVVEYSLIAAGITLLCVVGMVVLGGSMQAMFDDIAGQVAAVTP